MTEIELRDFLKFIQLTEFEGNKNHLSYIEDIIHIDIIFRSSGYVAFYFGLSGVAEMKDWIVNLYDPNLKEKTIKEILNYYQPHGVIPNNIKKSLRDKKILEILN
jgi:hypothetical protein